MFVCLHMPCRKFRFVVVMINAVTTNHSVFSFSLYFYFIIVNLVYKVDNLLKIECRRIMPCARDKIKRNCVLRRKKWKFLACHGVNKTRNVPICSRAARCKNSLNGMECTIKYCLWIDKNTERARARTHNAAATDSSVRNFE